MPSKTKLKNAVIAARSAALPRISDELMDQFVTGPMTGQAVNAATVAFKKALIERALGAELGHHLGYANGAAKPEAATNHRNGTSAKTVLTDDGPLRIDVPRDREGSFEPLLIPKHERRFTGFSRLRSGLWPTCLSVLLDRPTPKKEQCKSCGNYFPHTQSPSLSRSP